MSNKVVFPFSGVTVLALAALGYYYLPGASAKAGYEYPPTPVAVASVTVKPAYLDIVSTGELEAAQQVTLTAETEGRITKLLMESGSTVQADQPLVQLNDASEQAERQRLQAQLTQARQHYQRTRTLHRQGVATAEQLEQAQAALDMSTGELRLVESQIAKKQIKAPFPGVLGVRHVHAGQYLHAGDSIVSLVNNDTVYVNFQIDEKSAAHLRVGQPLTVLSDAHPEQLFDANITAIDPLTNRSRNVTIQAQLTDSDATPRAGSSATIQVRIPQAGNSYWVPETAINYASYGNTLFTVYTTESGSTVAKRTSVDVGRRDQGLAEILQGLQPEDHVVVSGQIKLQDQAPIQVKEHNSLALASDKGLVP